jgi:colanic acid biosynthesis glycosyl transferase WcaI
MRIGVITDRYAPEARAAATQMQGLAEGLAGRGHEVTVITRRPSESVPGADFRTLPARERLNGVEVLRLEHLSGSHRIWLRAADQAWLAARATWSALRGRRYDALLVSSPPLLWDLPGIAGSFLGTPFVLSLHDLWPQAAVDLGVLRNPAFIAAGRALERLLYRRARFILTDAPSNLQTLQRRHGIDPDRMDLLWSFTPDQAWEPPATPGAFRRRHGLEGKFVILYAGLLGLAQDLDLVLEAARRSSGDPGRAFVLMGDGPRAAEIRRQAASLPNVLCLPPAGCDGYFEAVRASDLCLVPLVRELRAPSVPAKLSAIMASRRPVVAALPPGNDARLVVEESGGGLVVEAGDAPALMTAIERVEREPGLADRLARNGYDFAWRNFRRAPAVDRCELALAYACGQDPGAAPNRRGAPCTLSSS